MEEIADWNGAPVRIAKSTGGVIALVNPWENLIRTSINPWPPPELVQKLYQSRQARAYTGDSFQAATSALGFYSDLQSSRSEDAVTWSFFGPIAYAEPEIRSKFVSNLLSNLGLDSSPSKATVWLWRRLPHPDSLVPGGPEIDFGIQTDKVFLLGEAKWRSAVDERQGLSRDKSQITLRQEFCQKYGPKILPNTRHFVVLGVSCHGGMITPSDTDDDGVSLSSRDITWEELSRISSHPCVEECKRYLSWKTRIAPPDNYSFH